ncbi:DUF805 domain-containing protein [Roseospira navarrensis]|uniref:DUF805 domain-containing protein n=1 Tax=Roseospira navarrensis TaxID=140058 RepID=UPI001479526D
MAVIILFYIVPHYYICYAITIQRLHDLNMGAIYLIMLGVPFTNLQLIFRLIAKPGRRVRNRFGPWPRDGYAAPVPGEPLPPAPRTTLWSLIGLFSDDVVEDVATAVGFGGGTPEASPPMRSMDDYDPPIRLRVAEDRPSPSRTLSEARPLDDDPWRIPDAPQASRRRRIPPKPAKPTFGRRQS